MLREIIATSDRQLRRRSLCDDDVRNIFARCISPRDRVQIRASRGTADARILVHYTYNRTPSRRTVNHVFRTPSARRARVRPRRALFSPRFARGPLRASHYHETSTRVQVGKSGEEFSRRLESLGSTPTRHPESFRSTPRNRTRAPDDRSGTDAIARRFTDQRGDSVRTIMKTP